MDWELGFWQLMSGIQQLALFGNDDYMAKGGTCLA
jgi:hypothetical protein